MTITIEIDDPVASQLQTTAASHHLTASQLAEQLLANALRQNNEEWAALNCRRIELIRKGNRQSLTSTETAELQRLQDTVDQRLEDGDSQLLDQLNRFRIEVEKLPMKGSVSS